MAVTTFAACNKGENTATPPATFTELVNNSPADKVWVSVDMTFGDERWEFDGSRYGTLDSIYSAFHQADYLADTATDWDGYDRDKKTFGYFFICRDVLAFSKTSSDVVVSKYFIDEFAIYNNKPLNYTAVENMQTIVPSLTKYIWSSASTISDTIFFTNASVSPRKFVIQSFDAASFKAIDSQWGKKFVTTFALRPKSEVAANGLTWVNAH